MSAKNSIALVLSLLLTTSCSSLIPTSYHSVDYSDTGYSETVIGEKSYRMIFSATVTTNKKTVEELWKKRAAELCKSSDYMIENFINAEGSSGCVGGYGCARQVAVGNITCK